MTISFGSLIFGSIDSRLDTGVSPKAQPRHTGRPPYDPADLLKPYLYGYLNPIRSSRKHEREAGRNIELLWLLRRLRPDFKTIANFRRVSNILGNRGIIAVLTAA
ncbi:MAG: transposase [Rhodocyclaceae bacterium]|nr:transposase [Rhodocyclaceae bacterium]